MSLFSLFGAAIIGQCFFSILYLSSFQWQRNKWLVVIFAAILLLQVGIWVNTVGLSIGQRLLIGNPAFLMLILPALFFYTHTLVNSSIRNIKYLYLHFLPFCVFYGVFLWIEVEPAEEFMSIFSSGKKLPIHLSYFILFFGMIFYYGRAILKLIAFNRKKYQDEYAETNIYLTLDWMKYLCWVLCVLLFMSISGILSAHLSSFVWFPLWLLELMFWMACMAISFFAFRQPTLYQSTGKNQLLDTGIEVKKLPNKSSASILPLQTPPVSSSKPLLNAGEIRELSQTLEQLLKEKQPYLQAKIRMPEMAAQLAVSSNVFSWFLNEHYQKNFFTFINEHRVQYAAKLLENPESHAYTLEAISKMAGFNSKTTFNTRFKEMMGETPSAYRKKMGNR